MSNTPTSQRVGSSEQQGVAHTPSPEYVKEVYQAAATIYAGYVADRQFQYPDLAYAATQAIELLAEVQKQTQSNAEALALKDARIAEIETLYKDEREALQALTTSEVQEPAIREAATIFFGCGATSKLTPKQWEKSLDNYLLSYPTALSLKDTQALAIDRIAHALQSRDEANAKLRKHLSAMRAYAECGLGPLDCGFCNEIHALAQQALTPTGDTTNA